MLTKGKWCDIISKLSRERPHRSLKIKQYSKENEINQPVNYGSRAKPAAWVRDHNGQFVGKNFFKDGVFKTVTVEKAGQKPLNGADYVDAITGGTITSQGVSAMIGNSFAPYETFFKSLTNNQGE